VDSLREPKLIKPSKLMPKTSAWLRFSNPLILLQLKKRLRRVFLPSRLSFRKIQSVMKKKPTPMPLMNRTSLLHQSKLRRGHQMLKATRHQPSRLLRLQPTSTMRMPSATLQGIKTLMLCLIQSLTSPPSVFSKEDLEPVPRDSPINRSRDTLT